VEEGIEEYPLSGFDPAGEPVVRRTAAGRLWLCMQLVPPSWVPDEKRTGRDGLGAWADFDRQLARAIRVPVVWEDREWFRIDQPREDTVALIHQFLLRERQWRDPHAPPRAEPGTPPEPFSFAYALDLGGFADAAFGVGGRVAAMEVYAQRDSLAHLADAVLQLTAGETEDAVVFDGQRGESHVVFRRTGAIVEVTVWTFDDAESRGLGPPDQGRVVLEGRCLLRDVREQVTAALEGILAEHGLAGYKDRAIDYDFPLKAFQSLEHAEAGAAPDRRGV
jgi:hypothetical protein